MTSRKHDTFLDALRARPLVVIETRFSGDRETNATYLKRAIADSISRGECPYASHAFFTQFLDDDSMASRQLGMALGWTVMTRANLVAIYEDLGVSTGMVAGIEIAKRLHLPVDRRKIPGWHDSKVPS